MQPFDIVVRNELTGEVTCVAVHASVYQEAQIQAVTHLFREKGWRKCAALCEELARDAMPAGQPALYYNPIPA